MRVKVGELKTHLSKYLRQLRESGEPIEVCVREEPVAYLTAANRPGADNPNQEAALQRDLAEAGLALSRQGLANSGSAGFVPRPVRAGDQRTDLETVRHMREEKPY